jgi:hypothetical protein
MGNIYADAREVVVWLGRDGEYIARDCFDLVRSTNAFLDEQLDRFGSVFDIPTLAKPGPICDDRSRWEKSGRWCTCLGSLGFGLFKRLASQRDASFNGETTKSILPR